MRKLVSELVEKLLVNGVTNVIMVKEDAKNNIKQRIIGQLVLIGEENGGVWASIEKDGREIIKKSLLDRDGLNATIGGFNMTIEIEGKTEEWKLVKGKANGKPVYEVNIRDNEEQNNGKQISLSETKNEESGNKKITGCVECNYTGYREIAELNMKVTCECQLTNSYVKPSNTEVKTVYKLEQKELMQSIIPVERMSDDFDMQRAINNARVISLKQNCKVVGFEEYLDTLNRILVEASTVGINNSYILGAPKGIGTRTFIYTCMRRLIAQGKKVVPYLSLIELAEKKVQYERNLLRNLNKSWGDDSGEQKFSWRDCLEADILFTFLSSISSKEIESTVLSSLIAIRGNKSKPTIVITNASIKPYTNDDKLKEFYWNDMVITNDKPEGIKHVYDKLIHVSCYRRYKQYEN